MMDALHKHMMMDKVINCQNLHLHYLKTSGVGELNQKKNKKNIEMHAYLL